MSIPSDRILNLLAEIKEVATVASMSSFGTHPLKGGVPTLISVFNKCLDTAEKDHVGLKNVIPNLAPDVNVDQVGVAAALLAAYLRPPVEVRMPVWPPYKQSEDEEDGK